MSKTLPKELTSYDLLKAVAVVIMIIDHAGYYFFPDELWFRAIGRIGFPVWFFLIGYARGRDIPMRLAAGAGILVVFNIIAGMSIIPLNALFTIILIRLLLDRVSGLVLKNIEFFILISMVLAVFVFPSFVVTEYGLQGLILALFGYAVRNRPVLPEIRHENFVPMAYCALSFASFIAIQQFTFSFGTAQLLAMCAGTAAIFVILYSFRSETYPRITALSPEPLNMLIRLMGRRTLEIYVAHLVLFKMAGAVLDPDRFVLFDWKWFSITGV